MANSDFTGAHMFATVARFPRAISFIPDARRQGFVESRGKVASRSVEWSSSADQGDQAFRCFRYRALRRVGR